MPLDFYKDFERKNSSFQLDSHYIENKISDIETFNNWYGNFVEQTKSIYESNNFDYFFRGMTEAKHKLYNSAQREWIVNDMSKWSDQYNYLKFIKLMIEEAKEKPLFKDVLSYYQIDDKTEADFPILSILQHYGSLSPLMDWTYNLDVALYFATENVNTSSASDLIDGYFSIYMIRKIDNKNLKNIFDYAEPQFPNIDIFRDEKFKENSDMYFACYISDFENNKQPVSKIKSSVPANTILQKNRPLTTYYNQNIIPQQGLFIFNPHPTKPLEEVFNTNLSNIKQRMGNLSLAPFYCYNIKKDLAEYIRRKISKHDIDNAFIYPDLRSFFKRLKENAYNRFF